MVFLLSRGMQPTGTDGKQWWQCVCCNVLNPKFARRDRTRAPVGGAYTTAESINILPERPRDLIISSALYHYKKYQSALHRGVAQDKPRYRATLQ